MDSYELRRIKYVEELAKVFNTEGRIRLLLQEAGVPMERLPRLDAPLEYWDQVCDRLFQGLTVGGVSRLVGAAVHQFPGNETFQRAARIMETESQGHTIPDTPNAIADFDVFLAHSSKDTSAVEDLANELVRRGLKPWLDIWCLPPGKRFAPEIARALESIKVVAAFVGSNGLGPWEDMEVGAALDSCAKDPSRSLIPVLLPEAPVDPNLPVFLRQFGWVRFKSLTDSAALDKLQWGVTGQHPRKAKA